MIIEPLSDVPSISIELSWDNVGFYSVVNKNYYGEYGCQAANALGVASKSLQVSGTKS